MMVLVIQVGGAHNIQVRLKSTRMVLQALMSHGLLLRVCFATFMAVGSGVIKDI